MIIRSAATGLRTCSVWQGGDLPHTLALIPREIKSSYGHRGLCAPGRVQVPRKKHRCSTGLALNYSHQVHSSFSSRIELKWVCGSRRGSLIITWMSSRESVSFSKSSSISKVRVGDTAHFGIDPIPSNYRTSIADTNTILFTWKFLIVEWFCTFPFNKLIMIMIIIKHRTKILAK